MDDIIRKNAVLLEGTAVQEPEFSHENRGERVLRFPLRALRLSGQSDCLWILSPEERLAGLLPLAGKRLRLEGQMRSFNNKSGQGSRLVISVLAHSVVPGQGEDCNRVELSGVICRPPILRRTPLGRCICDVMLAVNRRYGRADYLPCIAWGQVAVAVSQMGVGHPLALQGRLQSRQYTKVLPGGTEIRTAFEISIMQLGSPGVPAAEKSGMA